MMQDAPVRTSLPTSTRARLSAPGDPAGATPSATITCAVVGLGYVGLPTLLALRSAGTAVVGVDSDPGRLSRIRDGEVDLGDRDRARLAEMLSDPDVRLTADPAELAGVDAVIVCVPTPVDEHLVPDLTALRAATKAVVENAREDQLLVLTSTSYVGCTRDLLVEPLARRGLVAGRDVNVAFSPERIDPGVDDHRPEATPRVVGGVTRRCTERAAALLESTCPSVHRVSSPEIAEMAKLLENTFRAVNIALANEMADIAHGLDVPINEVIDAAATKPYGFMAFRPGPGVGGHCIPCDPHYLTWQMRASRRQTPLIDTAMTQIAARPSRVVARAKEMLADRGKAVLGSHVHVVGVAYKPGVADVRESPAVEIMSRLVGAGAVVTFDDPLVDSVTLEQGQLQRSRPDATSSVPDLVLVHTVDGDPHDRLPAGAPVLDAAFALHDVAEREVV